MSSSEVMEALSKQIRCGLRELSSDIMGGVGVLFDGHPTLVVVRRGRARPTGVEDGSLGMGTLMNAAYAVGVGSCWIHRAREVFDSEEGKALLKKWGVEGDYIGVGHCILGYPADEATPKAKPRKEDYIVIAK